MLKYNPGSTSPIPKVSDERIKELYSKITPVEQRDDGLYYLEKRSPWEPLPPSTPMLTEKAIGLEELAKIKVCVRNDHSSLFKYMMAEVLPQIPEKYLNLTVACKVEARYTILTRANWNIATTTLYKKANIGEPVAKAENFHGIEIDYASILPIHTMEAIEKSLNSRNAVNLKEELRAPQNRLPPNPARKAKTPHKKEESPAFTSYGDTGDVPL